MAREGVRLQGMKVLEGSLKSTVLKSGLRRSIVGKGRNIRTNKGETGVWTIESERGIVTVKSIRGREVSVDK